MKCPYCRKSETTVLQTKHTYNDDGTHASTEQVTRTDFELMECNRENCGVWYKNRCHYYTSDDEENE